MELQMGEGCSSLRLNLGDKWKKNYHTYISFKTLLLQESGQRMSPTQINVFSLRLKQANLYNFIFGIASMLVFLFLFYFIFQQSGENHFRCLFN